MDRRTPAQRRESFASINASWAIEGQHVDARDLFTQERIIKGELTHEDAIAQLKADVGIEGDGQGI